MVKSTLRIPKPMLVVYILLGVIVVGFLWWLSLNGWKFSNLLPGVAERLAAQTGAEVDFDGTYSIQGQGYSGTLLVRKAGAGYSLCWMLSDGSVYYGNGLGRGNILGAVCALPDGKTTKVLAFKKEGPALTGVWAFSNSDKVSRERTEDAPKLDLSRVGIPGTYKLEGTNPNASTYKGDMFATRTGATYDVKWDVDNTAYSGTALVVDSIAVAGYSNAMGLGLVVYKVAGPVLEGSWVYTDYERLATTSDLRAGTEKATRKGAAPKSDSTGVGGGKPPSGSNP